MPPSGQFIRGPQSLGGPAPVAAATQGPNPLTALIMQALLQQQQGQRSSNEEARDRELRRELAAQNLSVRRDEMSMQGDQFLATLAQQMMEREARRLESEADRKQQLESQALANTQANIRANMAEIQAQHRHTTSLEAQAGLEAERRKLEEQQGLDTQRRENIRDLGVAADARIGQAQQALNDHHTASVKTPYEFGYTRMNRLLGDSDGLAAGNPGELVKQLITQKRTLQHAMNSEKNPHTRMGMLDRLVEFQRNLQLLDPDNETEAGTQLKGFAGSLQNLYGSQTPTAEGGDYTKEMYNQLYAPTFNKFQSTIRGQQDVARRGLSGAKTREELTSHLGTLSQFPSNFIQKFEEALPEREEFPVVTLSGKEPRVKPRPSGPSPTSLGIADADALKPGPKTFEEQFEPPKTFKGADIIPTPLPEFVPSLSNTFGMLNFGDEPAQIELQRQTRKHMQEGMTFSEAQTQASKDITQAGVDQTSFLERLWYGIPQGFGNLGPIDRTTLNNYQRTKEIQAPRIPPGLTEDQMLQQLLQGEAAPDQGTGGL